MVSGSGKMTLPSVKMHATGIIGLLKEDLKPLPDEHAFYTLIGRIAAEWARFEHILDQIIWALADGPEDINSCITAQVLSFNGRIKAIKALATYRGQDVSKSKEMKKINKKLFDLSEKRNRFIHDAWLVKTIGPFESDPGQFKSITQSNNEFGFEPISKSELLDVINKIKELAEAATALKKRFSEKSSA